MAGLADAKLGKALRIMHEDAQRPWTVAALATAVGMSRSAFAARFTDIIGMPPIDYLANWRMTLAKAALASSKHADGRDRGNGRLSVCQRIQHRLQAGHRLLAEVVRAIFGDLNLH